jgi:hypothetical protein
MLSFKCGDSFVICHFTLNAVVSANPHCAMSWVLVANKVCVCDSTVGESF